ncbi:MAG: hypothetical protein NTY14_08850 [Candidatus Omnitrophica bacterium]|nr:hypothetical protein [Candidatus Omnitrophota bacterium]
MQNPSPEHQNLIAALINHFKTKLNFEILSADLPGYSKPGEHGRHSPDLVARDQHGVIQIGEAKVGDDIFSQTTKEEFVDFSNRIMTESRMPVPFHVVVYKQDEQNLIKQLNDLGLSGLIGNKIKIWTL